MRYYANRHPDVELSLYLSRWTLLWNGARCFWCPVDLVFLKLIKIWTEIKITSTWECLPDSQSLPPSSPEDGGTAQCRGCQFPWDGSRPDWSSLLRNDSVGLRLAFRSLPSIGTGLNTIVPFIPPLLSAVLQTFCLTDTFAEVTEKGEAGKIPITTHFRILREKDMHLEETTPVVWIDERARREL